MIVDASAVLAVVFNEEDADLFARILSNVVGARISAINYLEAAVRVDRTGSSRFEQLLSEVLASPGLAVVAATPEHSLIAREAYRRYGKGNHRASLNLSDCFVYALAKETGEPLLFKGGDFSKTDIVPAI